MRGLIVVLWRAGLRIHEALTLAETDLNERELLREGIPLPLIQRRLGHAYLSTTGTYLEGISSEEIIGAINGRKAPNDARQRRARALTSARSAGAPRRSRPPRPLPRSLRRSPEPSALCRPIRSRSADSTLR
jgi:hypothetical protein